MKADLKQLDILREQIRSASASRTPLRIRGNGTKDFYGRQPSGAILDTRIHAGIVEYDAPELVLIAKCGTDLDEIEQTLGAKGQSLAFEPPRYGRGTSATIGGVIASGLAGPRRVSVGSVRDFVLGVELMSNEGELLRFGGKVMKNVAGYDVSRLLPGSMGSLGLITEVALKVLPLPAHEATRSFPMTQSEAIRTINTWAAQPHPIAASCWYDGQLHVRLMGARSAVDASVRKLGGEGPGDADSLWSALRDHTHAFFALEEEDRLWRLAVPPLTPPLLFEGTSQLIEWHGGQRWIKVPATRPDVNEEIRSRAIAAGGHATQFRTRDRTGLVFTEPTHALVTIHRRLKQTFDPEGIFCPGRLYPWL